MPVTLIVGQHIKNRTEQKVHKKIKNTFLICLSRKENKLEVKCCKQSSHNNKKKKKIKVDINKNYEEKKCTITL